MKTLFKTVLEAQNEAIKVIKTTLMANPIQGENGKYNYVFYPAKDAFDKENGELKEEFHEKTVQIEYQREFDETDTLFFCSMEGTEHGVDVWLIDENGFVVVVNVFELNTIEICKLADFLNTINL